MTRCCWADSLDHQSRHLLAFCVQQRREPRREVAGEASETWTEKNMNIYATQDSRRTREKRWSMSRPFYFFLLANTGCRKGGLLMSWTLWRDGVGLKRQNIQAFLQTFKRKSLSQKKIILACENLGRHSELPICFKLFWYSAKAATRSSKFAHLQRNERLLIFMVVPM